MLSSYVGDSSVLNFSSSYYKILIEYQCHFKIASIHLFLRVGNRIWQPFAVKDMPHFEDDPHGKHAKISTDNLFNKMRISL